MTYRKLFVLLLLFACGCTKSGDDASSEQSSKEHIWKYQTDALEQAKQTKQLMQSAIDQQRRLLEEQNK